MANRAPSPTSSAGTERSTQMAGTLQVGHVAGIRIGVHYTWLLIFALITYSLAAGYFPGVLPNLEPHSYWLLGVASALLLFFSVLVHELSHSLVARARGLPVHSITLFIFGGVSSIEEEAESPRDEFLISFVGPLSSLVLAGLFWGLTILATSDDRILLAIVSYLATINLALAVFNLLPGFPLDGGRILRAAIWAVSGDLHKATNWASGAGQLFGFVLIAAGFLQIFGGNVLGGIWIAFIGWFLNSAAENSRQQFAAREAVEGVRVEALMEPDPPVVEASVPVKTIVDDHILRRGHRAVLVESGGRLSGIVSLTDVRKLPQERWSETTAGGIMTRGPLVSVDVDDGLRGAVDLMSEHDINQLVVFDQGEPVGMLTRNGLIRYLSHRRELGLRSVPRGDGEVERWAA